MMMVIASSPLLSPQRTLSQCRRLARCLAGEPAGRLAGWQASEQVSEQAN